jgi:hypothetical protein
MVSSLPIYEYILPGDVDMWDYNRICICFLLRDMNVCLLAIYEYILPGDVDMWLFIKSPHKRVLVSEICLLGVKSSTMQFLTLS